MMTSEHENGVSQVEDDIFVRPGTFQLALADPTVNVPIEKLAGIGKKLGERLRSKGVETATDLLLLFPRRYKFFNPSIDGYQCQQQEINPVALTGEIQRVKTPPPRSRAPVEVIVKSSGVQFSLIWFNMNKKWFTSKFKVGSEMAFWGDVQWSKSPPQMAHPSFSFENDALEKEAGIEPVYPLTEGLTSKIVRKAVADAWAKLSPHLLDVVPETLREDYQLVDVRHALETLHALNTDGVPDFDAFASELELARERLIYEECFTLQKSLAKIYVEERRAVDPPNFANEDAYRSFIETLPFELTGDQKRVLAAMVTETGSGVRMRRLLQGDVGSGKTVVALACAELARGNGFQAALMVPSEVLAQQHFRTATAFLPKSKIALLTGSLSSAEKKETLRLLRNGHLDLVVGTHALFQEDVQFADDGKKLGFVIIDEQHKFGVEQRKRLEAKAHAPHLLAMTATPIPRSLALSLFGDLDLTYLLEKPPGRQPIRTFVRDPDRATKVYDFVANRCREGGRAFVVFPSIDPIDENSPGLLLGAERLAAGPFDGVTIGVCHGRMSAGDREAVMQRFREGEVQLLCATTVIEVGVDVPEATVMVIDGAERFGLSQLHQLRGRVGRGEEASMCILIVRKSTDSTRARTTAFEENDDGFALADIDLQLRGGGEFLGERQSGSGEFRIANLIRDADVLMKAREDARSLLFGGST